MKLEISTIRLDGGTQMRAELSVERLADYAAKVTDGVTWHDPIVVFHDGDAYWLADGFHRVKAARLAGVAAVDVEVRSGTRRDAILFAVGANDEHGVPRTNADKRRAVETLLRDDEWGKWSDSEIARRTLTSQPFVGKLRAELTPNVMSEKTYTTKHGTTATMNTANIGKAKPATPLFVEDDDEPTIEREPDVYQPNPKPLKIDPPPQRGWGANELARFATDTIIALRAVQEEHRRRFANVDQHYAREAREATQDVILETIDVLRETLPDGAARGPQLSVIRGGR